MAKTITLNYKGQEYLLEFTLKTVTDMLDSGFDRDKVTTEAEKYLPLLFSGAFLAHHKAVSKTVIDELFAKIPRKMEFLELLVAMFNEPLENLLSEPDEDDEGKVQWGANW